jgi:hypothetical protein
MFFYEYIISNLKLTLGNTITTFFNLISSLYTPQSVYQMCNIGCSERRLIGHSFYRRNFLRKSCPACRHTAARTEKSDKPAQWTPYTFLLRLKMYSLPIYVFLGDGTYFWSLFRMYLSPWIRTFVKKSVVTHRVKNCSAFSESEGLLPC